MSVKSLLSAFEDHADTCSVCRVQKDGYRDGMCVAGATLFGKYFAAELRLDS